MTKPYIELPFTDYDLSDKQVEYFYDNYETVYLDSETVDKYKISTGYDHSWVNNVKNLPLIFSDSLFSVPKNEQEVKKIHIDAFPELMLLYDVFDTIYSADLSLIDTEVYFHHDGVVQENPHSFGYKIILRGSGNSFYMQQRKENKPIGQPISLGTNTNTFLINNKDYGHFVPKDAEPFFVVFVNGVYKNKYNTIVSENM